MSVEIPSLLPGDVGGMRGLASQLRTAAGSLEDACANVTGCVRGMTFEGPAAEQFRGRMHGADGELRDAAGRLREVAGRLERSADEVEAAQRAHDKAVAQAEIEQHRHGLAPTGGV